MSPVYIDAQGREHQLLTAEKNVTVRDPYLGFDRQIVEGQPVPPELEDAYRSKTKTSKPKSDNADEKSAEKPHARGRASESKRHAGS